MYLATITNRSGVPITCQLFRAWGCTENASDEDDDPCVVIDLRDGETWQRPITDALGLCSSAGMGGFVFREWSWEPVE